MKKLIIVAVFLFTSLFVNLSLALDNDMMHEQHPDYRYQIDIQNTYAIKGITDVQAFKLVNTIDVKLLLAKQMKNSITANNIIFMSDTGALDIFDVDQFCYTIEFKELSSGEEGVLSILYKRAHS